MPTLKTILIAVLWFMLTGALAYTAYDHGHKTGAERTLASMKATCDDEQAPTMLDGKPYMCVSKPQWNKVLEYVFQQGAQAGYKKGRGET